MRNCSNCGVANLDEAKFCHQCGTIMVSDRAIPTQETTKVSNRPSLDDLEFIETDLTNDNPKTLKMADKVSLHPTEETPLPLETNEATKSKRQAFFGRRETAKQAEPEFVEASNSPRLADTGDIFTAEVLANLDTAIDLDADTTLWQQPKNEPVAPETLAVPIEENPGQNMTTNTQLDSTEFTANQEPVLEETDLVTPVSRAEVFEEDTTTESDLPPASIASYQNNPIFKREPVYLKPETYGPTPEEMQTNHDADLSSVLSTIECPHCGHQNPDYYSFCQVCKKKLYEYDDQSLETLLSTSQSDDQSENDGQPDALFVPAYVESSAETDEPTTSKHKSKTKKHKPARKASFGWLWTLLLLILFVAGGVFAYFYFFASDNASAVYKQYSEAIVAKDYNKAASLTASANNYAWTGEDVEQMVANYTAANIDITSLLAANPEATELVADQQRILEVATEPSFLGLFPDYQVEVQAINVSLSVPSEFRDIAITSLSHNAQSITAGEAIVIEPRENFIIVRLTENGESREIGLDLNYSLLANGTLPISLKQVENRIQVDPASLAVNYPQEFKTTGFVIDGQEYTADIITLNGYVGQGFTVSIRGQYFGQAIESSQQEIHLADDARVYVSLADDSDLQAALQSIEAGQAENLANRTPSENLEAWLQSFQNDFVDAINFRAPDMLAKYGTDSQWYADTAYWLQNDVITNGIYYNTATYEIISVEANENGQTVLTTNEVYNYTLGGVAAVQAQSRVYLLSDNAGQLTIDSVEAQDIAY